MKRSRKLSQTIEQERGETYCHATYAVYEHGVYPRTSVLAGSPMRRYIDGGFTTEAEALAKYPGAEVIAGTTHIPVDQLTAHLSDETDY